MNLAKLILNNNKEYNGHKQFELNVETFTHKKRVKLLAKLEEIEPNSNFVLETYSDGSGGILQKDYWKPGEHHMGHTDRLIVSFE